jgi:hypothetical protein
MIDWERGTLDSAKDNKEGRHGLLSLLKERRVRAVSASDWHKIDHAEVLRGERERGEGLGGFGEREGSLLRTVLGIIQKGSPC